MSDLLDESFWFGSWNRADIKECRTVYLSFYGPGAVWIEKTTSIYDVKH